MRFHALWALRDVKIFEEIFLWDFVVLRSLWDFLVRFLWFPCEIFRCSPSATVFYSASAFNGDLSVWDVAKVTTMYQSKSIRILYNDLTWRELMQLCDWRVPSGVSCWWWWCGCKEIECNPMAHCNNVCALWQMVIFLWYFLMIFHDLWPLSQTRLSPNSRGDAKACAAFVHRFQDGGGVMGNMLRRGESSLLCMKFEFAFFAGHGVLIRILPRLFLRCLWMNSVSFSCLTLMRLVMLYLFHMRFPNGIFMLFYGLLRDFHMRFTFEISMWNFMPSSGPSQYFD